MWGDGPSLRVSLWFVGEVIYQFDNLFLILILSAIADNDPNDCCSADPSALMIWKLLIFITNVCN